MWFDVDWWVRLRREFRCSNRNCQSLAQVASSVPVLSDEAAAKRPRLEEDARSRANGIIVCIVGKHLRDSEMVSKIVQEEGGFSTTSESVLAILAPKSTATLSKRASSLRMLEAWYESSGISANLFDESLVYQCVRCLLMDNAPATGAAAAKEAINLIGGGLFNGDMVTLRESARSRVMTIRSLRSREETRQRRPITASMVLCLGKLLPSAGDLRKCTQEPVAQVSAKNLRGTTDTKFVHHKTARAGAGKALPISTLAFGLSPGRSWALSWLDSRRSASLNASVDGTLLPALKAGGWHKVAYTTP